MPFSNPLPAASKITKMKIPQSTPKAVKTVLNQLLLKASRISAQLSLLNSLLIAQSFYWFNICCSVCWKKTSKSTGNNENYYSCNCNRKIYGRIADIVRFNKRTHKLQ